MLVVVLASAVVGLPAARSQPGQTPPEKQYAAEYRATLKEQAREVAGLRVLGPDAPQCVRFEAEGLWLALPAGYPKQRPGTGVVTDFGVRGDFDIVLDYEVLQEPLIEAAPNATELRLVVVPLEPVVPEVWHKSTQNRALLARVLAAGKRAGQVRASVTKWDPVLPRDKWGNEDFSKIEQTQTYVAPATSRTGRLRLVRSGPALFFYKRDEAGSELALLHQEPFGTKDLKDVRVLGVTGGPTAALDVRVTELHIRADGLPGEGSAAPLLVPHRTGPRPWVVALAASLVLGGLLGLVAWRRSRRRAVVAALLLGVVAGGCADRSTSPEVPALEPPALSIDEQVLRTLDHYEPVFQVNADGRVVRLRMTARHLPDAMLAEVGKLTELRSIDFYGAAVSDAGLGELKDLQQLQSFGLGGTPISDAGLVHLQKLDGLRWLWLPRNNVTEEAVEKLKSARPGLNVYLQ